MMNTADQILGYGPKDASKLFSGDARSIKTAFRKLATSWHPDRCQDPKASAVFQRIMELRDAALSDDGAPQNKHMITFMAETGKPFKAKVLASAMTDYGKVHIGQRSMSYEFDPGLLDIARIERDRVERLRFADVHMETEMKRGLPELLAHSDLIGKGALNIFKRPEGEVLLSDFIDTFGTMPDVHAAWLGSGLLNIACYLEWAGLVHGAIAMDTVLVNPETHSVRLVGGWAFSTKVGERPVMLPNRTLDVIPSMAIAGQVSTHSIDLELIRRTLREVLGDPSGMRLKAMGVPDPVAMFLLMPPASSAMKDYSAWHQAIVSAWGKRRFIKFNGNAGDVYSQKK
ncbi:J domain-containing protein [Pseudosulfitobacter pseudonitzschiae]|uniref:J domain-containing protein n=1 Tax=Pseudosulfitobacter pseudonitzschiae TaxID=1402135 RepID=UPI003B825BAA